MKRTVIQKFTHCLLACLAIMVLLAGCNNSTQCVAEAKKEEETKMGKNPANDKEDGFSYVEKQEIADYNNKKIKYEIYMPKGSEVNNGYGFYNQHGIHFSAIVNSIEGYESFEDSLEMKLEYWLGPDTDYTDIYNSGISENGDDRYYILTGRGIGYDGMPFEIRTLEYMTAEPSGDWVNWNLEINQADTDEETDLIIAEIEECYGIDLEPLKTGSQLKKDEHDQDIYIAKNSDKTLVDLDGYKYCGTASLEDYYGEGSCPVIMPKGYYTNVGDSHAYSFMHGIWMTADVEEFYFGNGLMSQLKNSVDIKYEYRLGNTERIRNVWRSTMLPVPGFENALYTVISYEKKGCGSEEYFPMAEVLYYIQYDEEHYIALELFLSGEKYDDATNTVIQELEIAYGMNLSEYYRKDSDEEQTNDQVFEEKEMITLAKLIGSDTNALNKNEEILPDTVLWFNATYAPLTYSNGWNWKLVGGIKPTEENVEIDKSLLRQSWSISDRESALEKAEWLKEEGHRKTCMECIEDLKKMGLIDLEEKEFKREFLKTGIQDKPYRYVIAYQMYQSGMDPDYMAAWDLCRANQLYASFYICGYMTFEEAMDASLENSLILQKMYTSWEDMMDGYLLGYQFWQGDPDSKEDSPTKERRRMYEMMLQMEDNPYLLDWNMELKKSW